MSGESGNPHTELEIGRTLRLAREKRGLSLQQVEEATKIRARYLRDLENENFDVLPTVYVVGSLKTYAEHLGLDGAAMTGELKRRQASLQEQDQVPEVPPSREPRGLLASLGRLVGIGGTVEDEAGTMAPVRRPGLYVSLAVVLVFVLATYLASSIRGEVRPSVSVVREPTVSQAPTGIALAGNVEDDERKNEDPNKENQPERLSESPALDAGDDERTRVERSGQEEYATQTAQISSSVTASASASASASANASASAPSASPGPASAPATATPPIRVRPEPSAKAQPKDAGRAVTAALTDSSSARAPGGLDPSPGVQRNRVGSADFTRSGDRISTRVKISSKVKKTEYSTR
jgi:cytoskeletal protein RodZ